MTGTFFVGRAQCTYQYINNTGHIVMQCGLFHIEYAGHSLREARSLFRTEVIKLKGL